MRFIIHKLNQKQPPNHGPKNTTNRHRNSLILGLAIFASSPAAAGGEEIQSGLHRIRLWNAVRQRNGHRRAFSKLAIDVNFTIVKIDGTRNIA